MSKEQVLYITYRGKKYPSRDVYSPDTGDVTVSTIQLWSKIQLDMKSSSEGVRSNAVELDNQIAFYLDTDEQLELSTEEIVEIMKQNGYEI